jgi:DNA segregation ATPase FtsK/SpoIIIE-like protein
MSDLRMIDFSSDLTDLSKENLNNHDTRDEIYDSMLVVAAEAVVAAQQGSASLLQRKLNLGYNRCGKIIDELETIKVIGPFEGDSPRKVFFRDSMELNVHLKSLGLL